MLVGDGLVLLELLLHLLHHLHQSCVEAVLLGRLLVGVDELALLLGESKWKASTPAPAQREKKIIRWSGGSFQAEEGGEERVWECANDPVDHTCNASVLAGRPRFFSAGSPALSAPAATTAAPTYLARSGWAGTCCSPGHHSARSPPPCTPLPATGRGKVAERVRKSCALSRRRLATPSRESSASPARPGEAGPSEAPARRRRAPYDLQGRPEGLASRSPTQLTGTGARKRRGGACGNMREPTLFLRSRPAVSSVHECTNRANMGWSRSCKPGLA